MDAEYTMVAEARGQEVLWFRRFGSYQGEWLLLSKDDSLYYIYKDSFGSCSGCDNLEAELGYSDSIEAEDPKVQKFIADYHPFLEMKPEAALRVSQRDGNLFAVLPRNRREWQDEITNEEVGRQLALVVKADQGEITAHEILELDNQELRREAVEKFGAENFVRDIGAMVRDQEGENFLYVISRIGPEDFAFLYVKDPSTERRYVIRTNPAHQTVRAARAASFGIPEDRFDLAQET